jgi:hypothetical protein
MSALICLIAHEEMGLSSGKVVRVVDAYLGALLLLYYPLLTDLDPHRPTYALATIYICSLHSEVLKRRSFAKEIFGLSNFAHVLSFAKSA